MQAPITVPILRSRLFLLLLGSAGFVALGLWLLSIPEDPLAYGVGLVSILFFGGAGIPIALRLLSSRPGLVIDADGLYEDSHGCSLGRIPWREISGFRMGSIHDQVFLTVDLHQPQKFLDRGNFLVRFMNRQNLAMTGSPASIMVGHLGLPPGEVLRLLEQAKKGSR